VSPQTARVLVDAASLARELAAGPAPVLLDVRWRLGGPPGIDSYRAGHLPGAVFVDLGRDLAGPPGPRGRHPLPSADDFQAAMRRAGVSDGRPVVAYDDGDALPAARAWWLLRYFGYGSTAEAGAREPGAREPGAPDGSAGGGSVRVLDGGFRAWRAAGLPVSTDEPAVEPGDFTARPGHLPLLDAAGALALSRSGVLLDVRTAERYRGETEPVDPVAGHIPGAVNLPAAGNLTGDGTFRSPGELRERFASAGVREGVPVGAYCGSGVTAAQAVLALATAGLPAALYVGSWSEWVADPARPVATGPTPG
jgi:thiosulfate/3-mercaptopyruvate sulfurtransferase